MLLVLLLTGLADSFPSRTQNQQDNDYVDINEGALVKVEFSKTLRDGLKIFVKIIWFLLLLFSAESMISVFVWLTLMRDWRNPIYFQCEDQHKTQPPSHQNLNKSETLHDMWSSDIINNDEIVIVFLGLRPTSLSSYLCLSPLGSVKDW